MLATFTAYAALDVTPRVAAAPPRSRRLWVLGGSLFLALGICTTHALSLWALSFPDGVVGRYSILSLLAAAAASAVFLLSVGRPSLDLRTVFGSSILMGIFISATHYFAVPSRLRLAITERAWHLPGFVIAFSTLISTFAVLLSFARRHDQPLSVHRLLAALFLGSSIPLMRHAALLAVRYEAYARVFTKSTQFLFRLAQLWPLPLRWFCSC